MDFLDRLSRARALDRLGRPAAPPPSPPIVATDPSPAGFERRDVALSLTRAHTRGPIALGRAGADTERPAILGRCLDRLALPSLAQLRHDLECLGAEPGASPVFLDTETTGLGGVSVAFIIGLAWYEGPSLKVRQWTLARLGAEAELLADLRATLEALGPAPLVTFNGASFDLPLLRTRARRHGAPELDADLAHLDLLHPARRLCRGEVPDCSLGTLERGLLGIEREGDIDSAEIPQVFWSWLEDPVDVRAQRRMQAVLDHNLVDLASLPALAARLARRVREPETLERARRVARHLQLRGAEDEGRALLARFVEPGLGSSARSVTWREAALELAVLERRAGERERAARLWWAVWRRDPGCPIAAEALAKHLEHHVGDYGGALAVARASRLPCERRIARLEARVGVPASETCETVGETVGETCKTEASVELTAPSTPASNLAPNPARPSHPRSELLYINEDDGDGARLRYRLLR